jgi:hypothetical protein
MIGGVLPQLSTLKKLPGKCFWKSVEALLSECHEIPKREGLLGQRDLVAKEKPHLG